MKRLMKRTIEVNLVSFVALVLLSLVMIIMAFN
jgi:hypothetical protein